MAFASKNNLSFTSPIILAIETATLWGSVALVAADQCIAEYSLQSRLTHSSRLHVGIDRLMQDAALSWENIDGIAVSTGPGSFTGLRIGMSTAKGLVMATGKPFLGISTLDGLACRFAFSPYTVCPVLDARKKEVYTAFYRCDENGIPQRISELMVINPEKLCGLIKEPTILIGDGIAAHREIFHALGDSALITPSSIGYPRAACIGMLAVEKWKKNDSLEPVAAVPIYIRASDAELNFSEKSDVTVRLKSL